MLNFNYVVCHQCEKKHKAPKGSFEAEEFISRHPLHPTQLLTDEETAYVVQVERNSITTLADVKEGCDNLFGSKGDRPGSAILEYADNSSIKEAMGGATGFDLTSANLTNSATAGWVSNYVPNDTNLYRDAQVMADFGNVNTAPASNSAIYLYAYGLIDTSGSNYGGTGAANIVGNLTASTTLTFGNVTTTPCNLPLLGVAYYTTQNVGPKCGPFNVARCFGGVLPARWGIAMLNFSGMTIAVNSIKYIGIYDTVI